MTLNRRTLLAAIPALALWPARGAEAPALLKAYEQDTGGKIGVYAENLGSGRRIAWRAEERFVMCSTFKASLAACALLRVDRADDRLDAMMSYGAADILDYAPAAKQNLAKGVMSVAEMCEATVELSDNTCANLLLRRIGGPTALTEFWKKTGDTVSRLDHEEPDLNRSPPIETQDTTTPLAMAGTLRRVVVGEMLLPDSRDRLTGWMVNCKTGGNRLRAGLPKSWRIGDKTGNNGKDAFGDIAIAWTEPGTPIVICVYTQGGSPTPAQVDAVFAGIGRMVGEQLG